MEEISKIWGKANKNDRHIIDGLTKDKIERQINNYNEYYIKYIPQDKITTALDWGCGGGLLAKELKRFCDEVHGVDVSKDSIASCTKYAPDTKLHFLEGSPADLELPNVDLVLANAIVWHFPGLEYFKTVVNKWVSLSPKYIAFNTKKSETTKETYNYSKEFIAALHLADSDVENIFEEYGYTLLNKTVPGNTVVPSTHFIFERL